MLLEHVGEGDAARRVEAAVAADLAQRDPKNPGSTAEIGARLAEAAAG
jgi:3-isopropylmalate dehydrogenase